MSPSLKKLIIFSLAEGIGDMVIDQCAEPDGIARSVILVNASNLKSAGARALSTCHSKVDSSVMRRASSVLDSVCKDKDLFDISEMLSFLFLGLADLAHHCNDKDAIKDVEDAALNFITVYDPNLDDDETHARALEKYERWVV